jgi:flagellar hook assembly protein FlgD
VFDLAGRAVRSLASGVFAAGEHAITWDGRDDGGQTVPSGVYVTALTSAGVREFCKVVVMK